MRTTRNTIIVASRLMLSPLVAAVVLTGCVQNQQQPVTIALTKEQVDRACILDAGLDLRQTAHFEATAARALPPPALMTAPNPATDRTVELDTVSFGQNVTYVYLCRVDASGRAFTSPLGHR